MTDRDLFALFVDFLMRTEVHKSKIKERLICNSFLYPLRCHPNCFPHGRQIILAADKSVVSRSMLLVTQLTKTVISLIVKLSYRVAAGLIRNMIVGKDTGAELTEEVDNWLLIDHAAVIGGSHKRIKKASGYFPFIEKMEHKGLVNIRRVYHISEKRRFKMRMEQRVTAILGLWDILRLVGEEIRTAIKLVKIAQEKDISAVDRMGLYGAAIAQVSFKTIEARMIGERVRRILSSDKNLKGVITTFEGHAYERLVTMACAEVGASHIAYQHSPFLDSQYAVKSLDTMEAPSCILFSSRKAYIEMRRSQKCGSADKTIMIVVGGSDQNDNSRDLGKRREYFSPADMVGLPNGDDRELLLILTKAEQLMQMGMLRRLVLRFHPVAKDRHYELAKRAETRSRVLNGNIIMRKDNRIDERDCSECFYSLYVSSSASMKYLRLGIVPVIVGEEEAHLSPQSAKVNIDMLVGDLSASAYRNRLIAARRDYDAIYSRDIPEKMMGRVVQLMEVDARVIR